MKAAFKRRIEQEKFKMAIATKPEDLIDSIRSPESSLRIRAAF